MASEMGTFFQTMRDVDYANHLDDHGLIPLASEIPSIASDINARPVENGSGGGHMHVLEAGVADILHHNPSGMVTQRDGWSPLETSAK